MKVWTCPGFVDNLPRDSKRLASSEWFAGPILLVRDVGKCWIGICNGLLVEGAVRHDLKWQAVEE